MTVTKVDHNAQPYKVFLCQDANKVPIYCTKDQEKFLGKFNRKIDGNDSLKEALQRGEMTKSAGVTKAKIMISSYSSELAKRLHGLDVDGVLLCRSNEESLKMFDSNMEERVKYIKAEVFGIRSSSRQRTECDNKENVEMITHAENLLALKEFSGNIEHSVKKLRDVAQGSRMERRVTIRRTLCENVGTIPPLRKSKRIRKSTMAPGDVELRRNAGEASEEAVRLLELCGAIEEGLHKKVSKSHYPEFTTGPRKCHLRALHNINPDAAKQGHLLELKHNEPSDVKRILASQDMSGSVHRLRQDHWVSITKSFYMDDLYYYNVKDFKRAKEVLTRLEEKKWRPIWLNF